MAVGGVTKLLGNVKYSYPLEKLGCRYITISALVYAIWVLATSGLRGTATVTLCVILIVFLEIRVAVINLIIKPIDDGESDAYTNS